MRDLVSLRRDRAEAFAIVETVLDSDDDKKQEKFDAAADQVESLDAEIAQVERLNKLRGAKAGGIDPEDIDPEAPKTFASKYAGLPEHLHEISGNKALSAADEAALGDLLGAVRATTVSGGRIHDPRLVEASLGANETVGEDGMFLVEKDLADGLLRRAYERSNLASKVRRIPISARANGLKINALKDDSRAGGSRWGGVQMYHIGEGEALTPSRPKFRQMNLQLKKLAGLMYATSEVLQDTVALGAVIAEAYPDELAFVLDDVIFEGDGASQGLGFMNAGCKVAIAKETGQDAATILFANVTKMWARLPGRSIAKAEWWVNQDTMPQLMALHQVIGTGGVPVYLPPGGLSGSPYGTLLGRPVVPIEYANTLGTEGDIVLADPTNYVMIDKGDIQYATSIHVAFLTDEQAFRFIYRYDGQPVDDKPITPFKGTAKQSTFVTLADR